MSTSGMNYAPQGRPAPVVGPGEFPFAAMHLDHGHINGMCQALIDAGAELRWVYDPDPAKVAAFRHVSRRRAPPAAPTKCLATRACCWWPPPPSRTSAARLDCA